MKNLKTLTLILLAASSFFITSCKEVTGPPTDAQIKQAQYTGPWNLTKIQYITYDATTNSKLDEETMSLTDIWTFKNATITGTIGDDPITMQYSFPSANVMRLTEDGDYEDFDILNKTSSSFQLKIVEIDEEERDEITYHFTKK